MAHKATNVLLLRDVSISMRAPADPTTAGSASKAEQASRAFNDLLHRLAQYAAAHPNEAVNVAQIDFGDDSWAGNAKRAGGRWAPHRGTSVDVELRSGITVYDFTPAALVPAVTPRSPGGNTPLYSAVATALDLCRETDNLAGNSAHLVILLTDGFAGDERIAPAVRQALHERMRVGGWTVCYIFLGAVNRMVAGREVTVDTQAEVLGLPTSMVYAGSDLLGTPGLLKGLEDFLAARERDEQAIDHWFTDTTTHDDDAEGALEALRAEEAR